MEEEKVYILLLCTIKDTNYHLLLTRQSIKSVPIYTPIKQTVNKQSNQKPAPIGLIGIYSFS
jgi:hypothetical protein